MRRGAASLTIGCATLALGGCGMSGTGHRAPRHPEVFGADAHHLGLSRFVHRTGLSGGDFLVPASLDFSYVDLVSQPVAFGDTTTSLNHVDASVTARIAFPDRVELLLGGTPGTLARVGWVESCARARTGGEPGAADGGGQVTATIPAIIRVSLPSGPTGRNGCTIAAKLFTRGRSVARLTLVNYRP